MSRAVSRTLLFRSWALCSGAIVTLSVPFFLSSEEQGYYFAFTSLLAIQIFFELGLGQVLIYKFAASNTKSTHIKDTKTNELLFVSRKIYLVLSFLFFSITAIIGIWFFSQRPSQEIYWLWPWLILVASTAWNLAQSVKLAYLEATGKYSAVSSLRLKANIAGSILFLVMCFSGAKLWISIAIPISN